MADLNAEYEKKLAALEKAKKEFEAVRKDMIDDLLAKRRDIAKQLRALGHEDAAADAKAPRRTRIEAQEESVKESNGPVSLPSGGKRRRAKQGVGGKPFAEAYCSICERQGHDLRAHRGQKHKRAFSAAELTERGL